MQLFARPSQFSQVSGMANCPSFQHRHSWPMRASYGVSLVSSRSDKHSKFAIVILKEISYYNEL